MKIAAVQMRAELGEVNANIEAAERLATEAFSAGAQWVILPEFFTSAVGYHPKMFDVPRPVDGEPAQLLKKLAKKHNGVVGGSFIALRREDAYNTFILAFPDGTTYRHDKDQPTMLENCYFIGGDDDGVLETPAGRVGVALCWEFIRTRTVRRLLGRVDFVIGGSCCPALPETLIFPISQRLHERHHEILIETPARFARMLGVPVVSANHAGDFETKIPLVPGISYKSHFLGETQIVDENGKVLARMKYEDGEGFVLAEIDTAKKREYAEPIPDRFWIPEDMPLPLQFIWWYQNLHGKNYYRRKTKPYLIKQAQA